MPHSLQQRDTEPVPITRRLVWLPYASAEEAERRGREDVAGREQLHRAAHRKRIADARIDDVRALAGQLEGDIVGAVDMIDVVAADRNDLERVVPMVSIAGFSPMQPFARAITWPVEEFSKTCKD